MIVTRLLDARWEVRDAALALAKAASSCPMPDMFITIAHRVMEIAQSDANAVVRAAAVSALAMVVKRETSTSLHSSLLLWRALTDEDDLVRRRTVELLATMSSAAPVGCQHHQNRVHQALVNLHTDPDWVIKVAVLDMMLKCLQPTTAHHPCWSCFASFGGISRILAQTVDPDRFVRLRLVLQESACCASAHNFRLIEPAGRASEILLMIQQKTLTVPLEHQHSGRRYAL